MYKSTSKLVFLLSLVLIALACTSRKSDEADKKQQAEAETTLREAPNFQVTTIKGDTVSLQRSLGENKPMVVYFTASWCPICAKNWPVLSKVYPDYKDQLNFIAIGIDPTDTREVMTKLAKEKGFTFPLTWGHPKIMIDFGVESQATTVGINREGKIVFQKNKTALSEKEYRKLFDQLVS
ncbi:MAG TPA: TlpA disulfide reductase family protein [Balneolaceae bacterium]|nr:TlpA disulfide reductase family protein [Balneolaceae bacterium]